MEVVSSRFSLSFPAYPFRTKKVQNKEFIFDTVRKKFVALTPEEWVRQHVVQFLINEKKYPLSHIAVEISIKINEESKRCDVVVFNNLSEPFLIVECKSPDVSINQKVFDQIAVYNWALNSPFLFVTNGITHFICKLDYCLNSYHFLRELPDYQ